MPRPEPSRHTPHLLILGGTGDAAAVARGVVAAYGDRVQVTSSLAGRTRAPATLPGAVHVGGFGGPDGLRAWIIAQGVDVVIDATHPFATQISDHVVHAAQALPVLRLPVLRLERPPWTPQPGDDWRLVKDIAAAAVLLTTVGRRVFLTVGASEVAAFSDLGDLYFLIRVIETPETVSAFVDYDIVSTRGPFTKAGDVRLMKDHRIDVVVSKNSGGDATVAKLDAARALGIPVIMIDRPPCDLGRAEKTGRDRVETVQQALGWLKQVAGLE
jgi:precorrin-6A/cobalt-precorrin-6A reductase